MAKQRIHIYTLSRLAFAPVADWVRVLKELESGRKQMYWSYKPLRLGAFRLLKAKGTQQDNIYTYVANLAERAGGPKCRKANMEALRAFEDSFLPDIKAPRANLMEENTRGVDFANVELVGGPHFSVLDRTDETRYVYLHPSRWNDGETEAFCELLTIVLEKRFQSQASDLWFLDLRNRRRIPWPKSKVRLRRRCEQAAQMLITIRRAADLEEET